MRQSSVILTLGSAIGSCILLFAQDGQNEVRTRQLWNNSLRQQRSQVAQKPKTGTSPAKVSLVDNFIGVTLWRYNVSRPQDAPGVRMLVHESDRDEAYTPERCEANTALEVGQKVRLSIESARSGFLYIIDREQYSDGTMGDGELIFPTLKTHRGDNRVEAGRIIDIPGNGEGLFRIERRDNKLIGEELTLVVSPQPIPGLHIGNTASPVSREQIAEWRKTWGATVKQLEEPGQAGKNVTPAEKKAIEDGALLAETDAVPQTMYQVQARPGDPMLITVPLKIASQK